MDFTKILFKTSSFDVEKMLPDGVIFCSPDGKIQWVNDKAAELFETSKMDLKTSKISDFIENAENLISQATINDHTVITKMVNNEIYFEMSAKTRQGVNEGFSYAIEEAYHMAEEELNKDKIIIPNNNNNNNNSGCPGNKKKKK